MTTQQTRWMSIREAALALGVSELTVRRRIKDGKLAHRSENGKYYVDLDAEPPEQAPTALRAVSSEPMTSVEVARDDDPAPVMTSQINLDSLLREQVRLAEIAGRAVAVEEQLRALEARHAALQDGVITLASRNGWLESRLEDRERELKLLAGARQNVPWWRRIFGAAPASS